MQFTPEEIELLQKLVEQYESYLHLNNIAAARGYDAFLPSYLDSISSYGHLIKALKNKNTGADSKIEIEKSIQHLQRSIIDLLDYISLLQMEDIRKYSGKETTHKEAMERAPEIDQNLSMLYELRKDLIENKMNSHNTEYYDMLIPNYIQKLESSIQLKSNLSNDRYDYIMSDKKLIYINRYKDLIIIAITVVIGVLTGIAITYFQLFK